jgi:hypothetical protein
MIELFQNISINEKQVFGSCKNWDLRVLRQAPGEAVASLLFLLMHAPFCDSLIKLNININIPC